MEHETENPVPAGFGPSSNTTSSENSSSNNLLGNNYQSTSLPHTITFDTDGLNFDLQGNPGLQSPMESLLPVQEYSDSDTSGDFPEDAQTMFKGYLWSLDPEDRQELLQKDLQQRDEIVRSIEIINSRIRRNLRFIRRLMGARRRQEELRQQVEEEIGLRMVVEERWRLLYGEDGEYDAEDEGESQGADVGERGGEKDAVIEGQENGLDEDEGDV